MLPERFHRLREVLLRRQPDLTVIMDQVNKAHNFSAVLRSCDATGVLEAHAVPPRDGLDLSPVTSAGSEKWVRVHRHPNIETGLSALKERGFMVVAAHPAENALDFRDMDFTRPTAILLGAELHGVSPEGLAGADRTIAIPMTGMVQSLNVSVAAALLLFEAQRQRAEAGLYDQKRLPEPEFTERLFEWAYPRLARSYRSRGLPYPRLDADGTILDPVLGSAGLPDSLPPEVPEG
jgi:tRNA (guanosine-2'-O-)-methyltransferase